MVSTPRADRARPHAPLVISPVTSGPGPVLAKARLGSAASASTEFYGAGRFRSRPEIRITVVARITLISSQRPDFRRMGSNA